MDNGWSQEQQPEIANILLVDDRPDNLLALETILGDLGQNLVRAISGAEALRCLLKQDFAVILLDVQMPGMDGLETATLIRERERSRHTPIIFLTAADRNESLVFKGYAAGAVDYLFKPINPDILKAKVKVFVDLFLTTEQVKGQARQLATLNQELEVANQELDAFIYAVSHDLRAPLRALSGYSNILLRDHPDQLDEKARQRLEDMIKMTENMGQMIKALLDLSRLTRRIPQHEPVDLKMLAQVIEKELRQQEPERRVELIIANNLGAKGDIRLLRVALTNLLGNAWKFTGQRPQARIEFGVTATPPEKIYHVRDNGAGFDMAFSGRLFKAFQRLHSADEFPGTGVGLATVQRIIRRHGGRIWAESEVDKGATFYFTLSED
jgi:two-component system, sensor histidine kinase and response regulator